jgi:hypothetical protein
MTNKTRKNKRQLANVRFVHLRDRDLSGQISAYGGATLAYIDTVTADDTPITYAAVAYCHSLDRYNKETGRAKSEGRLVQLIAANGSLTECTHLGDDKYFVVWDEPKIAVAKIVEEIETTAGYMSTGGSVRLSNCKPVIL